MNSPGPARPSRPPRLLAGVASWFDFGRNMHLIVASAFAANLVGMTNFQYLPMYIRQLGGTIDNLAFFYTVQTVILAGFTLVGGWLVDRYNRRLLFSLTPAIAGISSLMHALAPSWEWLIPGLCLKLLSSSIGGPIFFSMTSDIAPPDRRAAFFGYQAMAFSVCGVVGPLVGGFFFEHVGYRWFLLAGALLAFTASYLRSLIEDPRENRDWAPEGEEPGAAASSRKRQAAGKSPSGLAGDFWSNLVSFVAWARQTPGVLLYIFLISISVISGKLLESYFSVYLNEVVLIAPTALGALYAASGLVSVPANLLGGRLGDRVGRKIMGSAGHILSGLWITLTTAVAGYPAFLALFALRGLVHGGVLPSINAWSADMCPSSRRGTFMAVLSLTGILLAVPAPALGAYLWTTLGPPAPVRAAGALSVLVGLLLFCLAPARGPGARSRAHDSASAAARG